MTESAKQVRKILFSVLSDIPDFPYLDASIIPDNALLSGDLLADSLDAVEILMEIEETFGLERNDELIPQNDLTVGELVTAVDQARAAAERAVEV